MLVNKFIPEIDKLELTVIQLTLAAIVLGIYVSLTDVFHIAMLNTQTFPFIFILGVVNTGIGFWLFSIGMDDLKGQSIAMLSYVDPTCGNCYLCVAFTRTYDHSATNGCCSFTRFNVD